MTGIDNWEYARWVVVIGRSLRLNPAVAASIEYSAASWFLALDISAKRPWLLNNKFYNHVNHDSAAYSDTQAIGKIITAIGQSMMKIPIRDATEKGYVDTLIAATGDRRYGDKANTIACSL